ncbi:DNA cytosine methyltransferase, partial [Neisseria gonorrhoeae]
IQVLAGIDYELSCKETYEANINAKFIQADIFELQPETLEKELGLKKNDDDLILIGCSPCQYWSVIQTDKRKSEKSKSLLLEFQRFVEYFNPGYVVVENVPGILSRMKESGLDNFIKLLEEKGFTVHFGIHNTADYGIPQSRKRFTLIANRITKKSWNQSSIRANGLRYAMFWEWKTAFPKLWQDIKTRRILCIVVRDYPISI